MNLVLDIAWTHVRARARQTASRSPGVATGVGFSIMMAALMEGSQQRLHAPADRCAAAHHGIRRAAPAAAPAGRDGLRGGRDPRPHARGAPQGHQESDSPSMGALEAWLPGAVAPSVQDHRRIIRYASRDVPVSITGIDPQREPKVSQLATQMRQGTLTSLYRTTNAMILGDRLAEKIGARVGSNMTRADQRRRQAQRPGGRTVRIRHRARSTRAPPTC